MRVGDTNWNGGDVNINNSQNININNNINRNNVQNLPASGQGQWQHSPANRQGVPYSNQAVAQKYNQCASPVANRSRHARRTAVTPALAMTPNEQQQAQQRAQQAQQQNTGQQAQQQQIDSKRRSRQQQQAGQQARGGRNRREQRKPQIAVVERVSQAAVAGVMGSGGGAFEGVDRGGSSAHKRQPAGQRQPGRVAAEPQEAGVAGVAADGADRGTRGKFDPGNRSMGRGFNETAK